MRRLIILAPLAALTLTACEGWENTSATPEPTVKKGETVRASFYDERIDARAPGKPANWEELHPEFVPVIGNDESPLVQKSGSPSNNPKKRDYTIEPESAD